MQITHLGHACVLVEAGGARLLIDPGNFSTGWHQLGELDAIVVTHQHPDHFDPENVPALLAANPEARVLLEPQLQARAGIGEPFQVDDSMMIGQVRLTAVGGRHAVIHDDIPRIGNTGVVISASQEPTFFHPGDALDTIPGDVDVVAVPAYGPWAAMKETIEFVRAVKASEGFLIHEALLSERGWKLTYDRLSEMTPTRFSDLRRGLPHQF